jgi:hypothetical protein
MDGAILLRRNSALFSLDRTQSLVMWNLPESLRPQVLICSMSTCMHARACITARIVPNLLPYTDTSCRPAAPLRTHEYCDSYTSVCSFKFELRIWLCTWNDADILHYHVTFPPGLCRHVLMTLEVFPCGFCITLGPHGPTRLSREDRQHLPLQTHRAPWPEQVSLLHRTYFLGEMFLLIAAPLVGALSWSPESCLFTASHGCHASAE